MAFKQFILDGQIVSLPEHYANHPTIGPRLVEYVEGDVEVDKVVIDNHELPLEQRITTVVSNDDWSDEDEFAEDTDDEKGN